MQADGIHPNADGATQIAGQSVASIEQGTEEMNAIAQGAPMAAESTKPLAEELSGRACRN